jgi:hypothetical protein
MLLSPVVLVERFPGPPPAARFPLLENLRNDSNRFVSKLADLKENAERDEATILKWVDAVLEKYVECVPGQIAKQHDIRINITAPIRIGNHTETIRPHRVVLADATGTKVALLIMVDTSSQFGRGRERTAYARFLELLRGSGHRLGLLTNGSQFRLIYAGLDFESWVEWESDRWFDGGDGTEELNGLRQLLSTDSLKPVKSGISGLLDAVEESRKRQADLSSVLRENVRQAVEFLLEDVSTAHRTKSDLFTALVESNSERRLTDAEAHEALLQATVRIVMRLVVCLFAESRKLLPVNDPIYDKAYGVRSLYELLEEAIRLEGGTHVLFNRQTAWSRLMALFRLIHGGSSHGAFTLRAYGGVLFRPGDDKSTDPVARALHILEHAVSVGDATIYYVLRKLLRGPLPVIKGRQKTFVEGPVDYTDLRTEFIGLIYEGLLDYRLKRTDEHTGPQIFLNLGREPVLPLSRLQDMMDNDPKGLKDLLKTLKKEKVTASVSSEDEDTDEDVEEQEDGNEETTEELVIETEGAGEEIQRPTDYLDSVEAAKNWACNAVVLAGLISKQTKKETDSEYQTRIEGEAKKLINKVVTVGEFYLVRAGNTRKGTGTFYTRPQLAVPTVHRTLEPLCYTKSPRPLGEGKGEGDDNQATTLVPKMPEEILGLKVCDPACGSASFLVAALHYMTDALYKSLCHHRHLDDHSQAKRITLPYGRPKNGNDGDELLPFPPDDPVRGDLFADRVKALLRRHVVERCIYGVDINPLAVEFARVSLWIETLDPELPFSFLDHKIKIGNSLVGCWLDRVEDYPLKAWEREGGDGKDGPRTQRIEEFLKGEKIGNRRSGVGQIKKEMREVIESKFSNQPGLFPEEQTTTEQVVAEARKEYEKLHTLPIAEPDERERFYREHVLASPALHRLKQAMDEWCAIWFWPTDEESLRHAPMPLTFHEFSADKNSIVQRLAESIKFFHWEIEFPDVFSQERRGFDCVVGNPPWETIQQESLEFFSDFDPLYRTYGNKVAKKKRHELFSDTPTLQSQWTDYCLQYISLINWSKAVGHPFEIPLARGNLDRSLHGTWGKIRSSRRGYAAANHPFAIQGSGKCYTYKLFLEIGYSVAANNGRIGFIVPSGIYSEKGAKQLRNCFLSKTRWEWLFGFRNKKKLFNVHADTRFACIIAEKAGTTESIHTRFRAEDPSEWESTSPTNIIYTTDLLHLFSPNAAAFIEVRSDQELHLNKKIYSFSRPLGGDSETSWRYGREYNTTDDSFLLRTFEELIDDGYELDRFGRMISATGLSLPVYQGSMVDAFDASGQAFSASTGTVGGKWKQQSPDQKRIASRYYMKVEEVTNNAKAKKGLKAVAPLVSNPENGRTMFACLIEDFPSVNSVNTGQMNNKEESPLYSIVAVMNSIVFDFALRTRMGGLNMNPFVVKECPYPAKMSDTFKFSITLLTLRLCGNIVNFAPQWLKLKRLFPELGKREWKHWWAVTEADRLRLRVEIDALCADLYGLNPDDFDWIVRDDPTDSKGFYRVDRELPFRERLTGLAGVAFRALKEGKWSAETVGKLSNDEFFEILGIPELTNTKAAHAKGLPDPLILKRDGCHVWKPENFPPDDPRHGWTWDDCWKDAVALLGSEEAVQEYITEKPEKKLEADDEEEPFRLKADKPRARQNKMF